MKYAEHLCDWLVEEGYTHCFFVAGGNVMHLLDAARTRFTCVPFVHEVGAGIATEYFNEIPGDDVGKAFALVTAGPGLTNVITAMAGAFLESRELLVIGGQVKSTDLASSDLRQRGIQEINGIELARSVCKSTLQITHPLSRSDVMDVVLLGSRPRKGPVFLEICLDAQGAPFEPGARPWSGAPEDEEPGRGEQLPQEIARAVRMLEGSRRPLLLLGGGISRLDAPEIVSAAEKLGLPIATTWNAADRIGSDSKYYFGRPNTWGMRYANVLLQQADVILAAGTRLGLQQTGFNWEQFAPMAKVIQIDLDAEELSKGHPKIELGFVADAAVTLLAILESIGDVEVSDARASAWAEWTSFGHMVRDLLPLDDSGNSSHPDFLQPFAFLGELSKLLTEDDVIVPCSSGGAFTVSMQALEQKSGQRIVTDKGLASMGYGLAGAIGASLANPGKRVILIEGDGGFAQNLQEIGTAVAQSLPIKMFIFCNDGYASIRMTQRSYFGGTYVGCDVATGLGLPDWNTLFAAYGVHAVMLDSEHPFDESALDHLNSDRPVAFLVSIDPEQTYYPKINSRATESGSMVSNPLHVMHPDLPIALASQVLKYLTEGEDA